MQLGIRWTIGDVSDRGFDALALSVRGARRIFGDRARYAVCVNSVPADRVRDTLRGLGVEVHQVDHLAPDFLREHFDADFAEGVGWKFAPPRLFPDHHELALDNDCILWELPEPMERWLASNDAFLLAEDVEPAFGRFTPWCGQRPRNSGIRGLPPGFDLVSALEPVLDRVSEPLTSELDEQGLQIAALLAAGTVHTVTVDEVTLCSPFPPKRPHLGRCGAHFVGLNARRLPWSWEGRPAEAWIAEHYDRQRPHIARSVRPGAPRSVRPGDPKGP